MILYLDASALVKEYLVGEPGARDVASARQRAELVGTSSISRAETAAALAKAARMGVLQEEGALAALQTFRSDWLDLVRIQLSETVLSRADILAWEEGLRGFDAVHLASALMWQESLGLSIVFAAYDVQLWNAGGRNGLALFPDDLPSLIEKW